MSVLGTDFPDSTTEFQSLRNFLANHPESELCLLSAYHDWPLTSSHLTSPYPTNIAIFECIYLTPQHIALAMFLAARYSIDVIEFTLLGDNDDESFVVVQDHPFFDFHFPRIFGPGLPCVAELKPSETFEHNLLGRTTFRAGGSVDCFVDCSVDIYGSSGGSGASLLLYPSLSDPSCFTPLCVSTPTTNACVPRVIPPTHTPRLRLWDHFSPSNWSTEWPDFAAEEHWSNALELASRPALPPPIPPVPPEPAQPPAKITFKLRPTAAAWFPRRKRTRRPCHARPHFDPKGARRTPPATALYDLAKIAHAYRQALPQLASNHQAPQATVPLPLPSQLQPKTITRRPAVLPSPAVLTSKPTITNRSLHGSRRRTPGPHRVRALLTASHLPISFVLFCYLLSHWVPMFDQAITSPAPLAPAVAPHSHAIFFGYIAIPLLSVCYIMPDFRASLRAITPYHYCVWPPRLGDHPIFPVLQYVPITWIIVNCGVQAAGMHIPPLFKPYAWLSFPTGFSHYLSRPPRIGVG